MEEFIVEPAEEPAEPLPAWRERPRPLAILTAAALSLLVGAWLLAGTPWAGWLLLRTIRPPQDQPLPSQVREVSGGARVRPAGSALWLPATVGIELLSGDQLQTSADGRLRLTLSESIWVTLYPASMLTVVSADRPQEAAVWLEISRGTLAASVRSDSGPQQVLILTPWGTASAGRSMGVRMLPDGGGMTVACFDGSCSMHLGNQHIAIPAGAALTYSAADQTTAMQPISRSLDPDAWAVAMAAALGPSASATAPPSPIPTPAPTEVARPVLAVGLQPPTSTPASTTEVQNPSNPQPPASTPTPEPTRDDDERRGGDGDGDNGEGDGERGNDGNRGRGGEGDNSGPGGGGGGGDGDNSRPGGGGEGAGLMDPVFDLVEALGLFP